MTVSFDTNRGIMLTSITSVASTLHMGRCCLENERYGTYPHVFGLILIDHLAAFTPEKRCLGISLL